MAKWLDKILGRGAAPQEIKANPADIEQMRETALSGQVAEQAAQDDKTSAEAAAETAKEIAEMDETADEDKKEAA